MSEKAQTEAVKRLNEALAQMRQVDNKDALTAYYAVGAMGALIKMALYELEAM